MLCGAVIGGIEGKGKGRGRDDETKEAAAQCLLALLRERTKDEESSRHSTVPGTAEMRLAQFKALVQTQKFMPIFGQTLNSLLSTTESRRMSLQKLSLDLLYLFIHIYAPDHFVPSVLPGVVSGMDRVAVGASGSKGWVNGDIVASALKVMQTVIVKSIGDDLCIAHGAIQEVEDLEDLAHFGEDPTLAQPISELRPYETRRTSSWLGGTSSQLQIAINSLTPLVAHPKPAALLALSKFSSSLIGATPLTLSQTQPLLLSFLLSLSNSDFITVSSESRASLLTLLTTPSKFQYPLLQTLMRNTRDNLAALPRLIPSHADAKVEHVAGLVEAVCRLASSPDDDLPSKTGLPSISAEIRSLLGPRGGIEKWGWGLLSVLEFVEPTVTITRSSAAQLILECDPEALQLTPFPELKFRNISSRTTQEALVRMFHALGRAGGDGCLFSVEWFMAVGLSGTGCRSVAAIWCACRLLEGICEVSLSAGVTGDAVKHRRSARLVKLARSMTRCVAELWDEPDEDIFNSPQQPTVAEDDERTSVQHIKGFVPLNETLKIIKPTSVKVARVTSQPMLHKALSLQLIAVASGILQARFTGLFIYTLYPVLRSLVSSVPYLSSSALAALNFITVATSYASPANLLLSNFDYALDAASRRLSRRWLDIEATKVLVAMVRLVGSDIVEKAGDVVEECFDRLDEFHGYDAVVEGLIEVLSEVMKVIESDVVAGKATKDKSTPLSDLPTVDGFLDWFAHRHEEAKEELDDTDFGPAPREAWGQPKGKENQEELEEEHGMDHEPDPNADPPPTPAQALIKQIVSRSLYFLTHGSPVIRARILMLLSASIPVLPDPALLPSIHSAWPFILNRLADTETFVIVAAATLIEALATHVGSFMFRRIWDDVWPKFRALLDKLDSADATNALSRRGYGSVGTESAYTHSHRLYRSLLKTMTAAMQGVHPHDQSLWQVMLAFRRFLHDQAHEELQCCARDLYLAIGIKNADAVWLALSSTCAQKYTDMAFLFNPRWDLDRNVSIILNDMG